MYTQRTMTSEAAGGRAALAAHPAATNVRGARTGVSAARTPAVSPDDVRDLIDAAGPLSLHDIAGGLGVPVFRAAHVVNWMLQHDCLRQDEWRRHTLLGSADAV